MKKVVIGLLAVFGALLLLSIVGVVFIGFMAALSKPGVPSNLVLEIDFEGGVIETTPDDPHCPSQ